jgi:O-antigen/teichoic acid export membrane protein
MSEHPRRSLKGARLLAKPAVLLSFGLAISAVAGSGFLAILNRSVSSTDVVALSGLNFLLATVSTGVMAGLEQEMTRAVSRALAVGDSPGPAIRRQVRQAAWLIGGTIAFVGVLSPVLVDHWLGGRWYLFGELLIGLIGALASFQVRGMLSGRQDFRLYSFTLIVEGLTRLAPSILILALGVGSAWMFGLLFALGPVFAAVSGLIGPRGHAAATLGTVVPEDAGAEGKSGTSASTAESDRRAASNLALLTGATLASQLLLNSVPLLVVARYSRSTDHAVLNTAAAINSAVGLTRLGILMLLPLQAPLLPRLTAAAAHGRLAEVRARTLKLGGLCAAVGLIGVLASGVLGPWALRTVMSAHAPLPGWFLALFASGTLFMMIGYILQSALIAMGRHKIVMIAWGAGAVITVPVFATGGSILATTAFAAVAGPLTAAAMMAVDAWWSTSARWTAAEPAVPPAEPVRVDRVG